MDSPVFKRRKFLTKRDIVEKLKDHNQIVSEVVDDICDELSPFDVGDSESLLIEDRLNRLDTTSKALAAKVYRLKNEMQKRKYRHNPELLDEKEISASQYSIFESQEYVGVENSQELSEQTYVPEVERTQRPSFYKKKSLTKITSSFGRRQRVREKREQFSEWAIEEGVTVTQLLGYLLYLEEYQKGDRDIAHVGWKLFCAEPVSSKPEASLEEATWMVERASMSQSVYLDIRLRFLDRFKLPPVNIVVTENKQNRPPIFEYEHGVKAPLLQCLSLTLSERLKLIDMTGLDQLVQVNFKFNWGLDGSGDHRNYHQLSKTSYSTKQVMSVCFALSEVKVKDGRGREARWSGTDKGANKPQNVRPLALFPGKETKELMKDIVPKVEEEIKQIERDGVNVKIRDEEEICADCDKVSFSMTDGKMVSTLLQLGGAYCTMCSKSIK